MTKKHEEMVEEGVCPRCNYDNLWREHADVGIGVIYGPWGCSMCGWSEYEEYDLDFGGGVQDDGSFLDQYGMQYPATHHLSKIILRESKVDESRPKPPPPGRRG